MVERLKTGITSTNGKIKLDDLLKGGIPIGNSVVVTGASGTGKSNFCYQVTAYQAAKGKKCLYVAFDQTEKDIIENAKAIGVNLRHKNIEIITYRELDDLIIDELIDKLRDTKLDLVTLDSIASISGAIPEEEFAKISQAKIQSNYLPLMASEARVIRRAIRRIIMALKKHNITALLINELPEGTKKLSKDDESDYVADGVIVMYYMAVSEEEDFRSMQIRKMRKTGHKRGMFLFSISNKGIVLEEDPLKKLK